MINKKKTPRLAVSGSVLRRPSIESMESRRLLSASPTFMAGRFWDFAPAQNPPMLFARPGPSEGAIPGAASPNLLRSFAQNSIETDRFESPWHSANSSDSPVAWTGSNQFQGDDLKMDSGFNAMNWQSGPALIIDIPTAFSLPGGATTEVVYSISISGPFFSAGSMQGTTLLMATSFQGNRVGMFNAGNGFAAGGTYRDGGADRAEMPEQDDYAPPATPPTYHTPSTNVSTSTNTSDAPSAPTARPNVLHSPSAATGSTTVASVGSANKTSHTSTSPVPAVSAVTSVSGVASTAATIASVTPRVLMQESAAILHTADEVVRVVGGTLATTGASAATTIVPQVTHEVKSFAAAAPIVIQETAAVAQAVIHVNPIDAVATFSDALAAFARDCAGIGTAKVDAPTPHRAWAITGAVLAADVILIGQWYARRSRNQQESEEEQKMSATPEKRMQPMLADLPLVK